MGHCQQSFGICHASHTCPQAFLQSQTATDYDGGFTIARTLNLDFTSDRGIVVYRVKETKGEANWLFMPHFATSAKPFSYFWGVCDVYSNSELYTSVQITCMDSTKASLRINTGVTNHPSYGPNTCTPGKVWREGDPLDLYVLLGFFLPSGRSINVEPDSDVANIVCVTTARRTQFKSDNAQAAQRRASGSLNGYV